MQDIRQATLQGTWYPEPRTELAAMVDGFLSGSNDTDIPAGRPLLAVSPHAGYAYSGLQSLRRD